MGTCSGILEGGRIPTQRSIKSGLEVSSVSSIPSHFATDTAAVMGYSSDFMSHIGGIPERPGQFILAGFSGHGMPEILLSSKAVVAMVRDGIPFENTGLPSIFKTTTQRIASKSSPLEESLRPLWETKIKAKLS